jgi:hypothetical protein
MTMAKQPRRRIAEQKYIKRVRELVAKRKKRTTGGGRTPWKQFFDNGIGAEIRTEIPKPSIHSIVYTYGKKLGKRFICSYEEIDGGFTLVKIEAVKRRS